MTQEQKREDLLKRVDEAKAYCRAVLKFAWEPQLQSNAHKVEAVDMFFDFKEYESETKEVDTGSDQEAGSAPQAAGSTDGQENPSEETSVSSN